jgi:pimeloyl-ACP methyl ester carboxylesterase
MRWYKQAIESSGVRLAVRDSAGHGTPVVLVHGLGTIQRSWDRVAPLLASHLRVVTYDQRGHGGSQAADEQAFKAAMARPLHRLLGRVTTALGLGVRLSTEKLWQMMQAVQSRINQSIASPMAA